MDASYTFKIIKVFKVITSKEELHVVAIPKTCEKCKIKGRLFLLGIFSLTVYHTGNSIFSENRKQYKFETEIEK